MSEDNSPDTSPQAEQSKPEVVHLGQEFLVFAPDQTRVIEENMYNPDCYAHLLRDVVLDVDGMQVSFKADADAYYTRGSHPALLMLGNTADPDAYTIDNRDYNVEQRKAKMREWSEGSEFARDPKSGAILNFRSEKLSPAQIKALSEATPGGLAFLVSSFESSPTEFMGELAITSFYPTDFGPLPVEPTDKFSRPGLPLLVPAELKRIPEVQALKGRFISRQHLQRG